MEQFKYNPEDLTQEQRDKIAAVIASCNDTLKRLEAEEDARMERYYNCEDDYSWGGPCTQANYKARARAERVRYERIEMIVRGGFLLRHEKEHVLKSNETGEVVARGIHDGKYGPYFRTEDGKFIGCAKQLSTLEKKGFVPYLQEVEKKIVPDGFWQSGDRRYKVIELNVLNEEVSVEWHF